MIKNTKNKIVFRQFFTQVNFNNNLLCFFFVKQEMREVPSPLAAMAATPRIELDNKYTTCTFNPVLAKVIKLDYSII